MWIPANRVYLCEEGPAFTVRVLVDSGAVNRIEEISESDPELKDEYVAGARTGLSFTGGGTMFVTQQINEFYNAVKDMQ